MLLPFLLPQANGQEDSSKTHVNFGIYPVIGYSPITNLQLGAISFFIFSDESRKSDFYRPTTLNPYFIYTLNKQIILALDHTIFFGRDYMITGDLEFFDFPNQYFGLGNETDPEVYERVRDKYVRLEGRLFKIISPRFFVGMAYDLQYNTLSEIVNGGLLESDNPPGISGGRNMGLGVSVQFDTRDNTLYPTKGYFLTGDFRQYGRAFGGQYTYSNFTIDLRKYMELFGPKNLLTFQVAGDFNAGNKIPFYKLPKLGGDDLLRGIDNENLYRDRNLIYAQVEARQDLFWRFGGVIFLGAGQVFHSLSEMKASNTRLVYGLGGRFQAIKDEKMNIRIDLGLTDNGQNAFYISIREAF